MGHNRRRQAEEYIPVNKGEVEPSSMHEVQPVVKSKTSYSENKEKFTNLHFKKEVDEEHDAHMEVAAQELFRLFRFNQPKTRHVVDAENRNYVVSKGVPGFIPLNTIIHAMGHDQVIDNIRTGKFTGLGEILVLSLLMNEIDLRLPNIGIDENGRCAKIDGDWCWAHFKLQLNPIPGFQPLDPEYKITSATLNNLPSPYPYHAFNFLDTFEGGLYNINAKLKGFGHNVYFRNEVNSAILKIMLLPEDYVYKLLEQHIPNPNTVNPLYTEFCQRKMQLIKAASTNEEFLNFVRGPEAEKVKNDFITYLKDFTIRGKTYLAAESKIKSNLDEKFLQLREAVSARAETKEEPKLTQEEFKNMLIKYKNSKDASLFGLRWLVASKESSACYEAMKKTNSDVERYKIAENFISAYPDKRWSKILKEELTKNVIASEEKKHYKE